MTTVPCYTGRPIMADLSRHDGGLRPAVGVHNFQVLRANRTHPEFAAGTSFTYNHAPMLCYWKGRFYLQYLSSPVGEHEVPCHTLVCHSEDGVHWSKPQVAFPAITTQEGDMTLAHQRMGFYVSKSGRLLTLSFYGRAPRPNDGTGIGRAVREIYEDGSFGPLYFIRYNPGFGPENTPFPHYTASPDAGFREACDELLANALVVQQWEEEDCLAEDDFYVLRTGGKLKAFCWYTLPDGRIVGLWKSHFFTVADRWEKGAVPPPAQSSTIVYHGAKAWGQRTSDGRYALVYNPVGPRGDLRYPLAITTGDDGLLFDRDLLAVHGEVPPQRYGGWYKVSGPQYVRGIAEGNGVPPDGALWLTYSVHKEDIWVARVPVPVRAEVTEPVNDTFETPGALVEGWNVYSPLWAPVAVVEEGGERFLRLRDKDPVDYAKAVRVFPESRRVELSFRVRLTRKGQDDLEIDVVSREGKRPVRLVFDARGGRVLAADRGVMKPVAGLEEGRWLWFAIDVDAVSGRYRLRVSGPAGDAQGATVGKAPGAGAGEASGPAASGGAVEFAGRFSEDCDTVERLELRTGPYRMESMERLSASKGYLFDDMAGVDEPVEEAVFDIDDVRSRH